MRNDERMSETKKAAETTEPNDVDDATTESNDTAHANGDAITSTADVEKGEEEEEDDLLPRGNPLRRKRGLIAILVGAIPAFLLMAKNGQNGWGIPVGFLFVAVCAFGVMDFCGSFDDETTPESTTTLKALITPLVRTAALVIAFGLSLWAAQSLIGPWWLHSILVTGTFVGLVASTFDLGKRLGPWKTDELGLERPLFHRHGFWLVAIGAVLYFPAMGLQSLWDPWETHYGEVAREILSRDDWISLWWVQDGWFFSKPILNFWIQSLAMGSLGTHYLPGQMLFTASGAVGARPEWIVRAPNVLMTIGAMYVLYKGVAKVFGRRAGLLGGLVLATMPDWFFLAHQTMTDMPFVASMTAAMGLLLFGLNTDEEARVKVYEVDAFGAKFRVSLWHLVFGAILLCAIPQILYLASRNLELVIWGDGPKGFRLHWDEFMSGSAGNCGQPGNAACAQHVSASIPKIYNANKGGIVQGLIRYFGSFEPSLQAVVWAGLIGVLLYLNWGERRVRRIVYIAAWLGAAVATMAKGPAGFVLPMLCAFAYIATKKRWGEFTRLELLSGSLVILAVALPWYVAMYVRHGSPFIERLIIHDMVQRTLEHVHDTNEGDDTGIRFYVWQLGYALFPWTGLAPLGLLWSFRRSDSAVSRVLAKLTGAKLTSSTPQAEVVLPSTDAEPGAETKTVDDVAVTPPGTGAMATGDAAVLLVMWFLFAFALFSFMGTKFHHYIFPAVPPIAMLIGVVLDDVLGEEPLAKAGRLPLYVGGLFVAAAVASWGARRFWDGSLVGKEDLPPANVTTAIAVTLAGFALAFAAVVMFGNRGGKTLDAFDPEQPEGDRRVRIQEQLMISGAAVAAAAVIVLVGRDLAIKPSGSDQPGAIRLLQLFTYNYRRPWPDNLDFSTAIAGFVVVGALVSLAMAARAWRRHAAVLFSAFALVWALWGLDVYMVKLSPHWGQRELMEAYYKDRKSPDEMLVAYQMNWKGENFYTGNRIPVFVSTGTTYQNWLKEQREKGVKVLYFVTEHSRKNGLRNETSPKTLTELTDKNLNNKFILLRAEL